MLGDTPEPERPDHIGPYEIEDWLGEGGMGEVARARDRRLDRRVAIKRIRGARLHERSTRERFRREAWSVAQLNHPAIVQIYDIVSDEEHDWIVMELVEGETLTKRLKRGPLDPAVALNLMRDVASGLAEAHEAGIVHRDIKSDNIMITPKGAAKILDFGLARPIEPDALNPAVTMVGAILGTPHAMSPEQATGRDIDHRSDLFSLGSLFYLAVTGRSPFRGPTALETLRRVRTRSQPPAKWLRPELPGALSDLIDELLRKEPDQRPQDTSEIAQRLEEMVRTPFAENTPADDVDEGDWTADAFEDSLTAVTEMTSIVSAGQRQVTVLVCEPVSPPAAPLSESVREEVADDLRKLTRDVLEDFGAEIQPAPGHDESSPAVSVAGAVACFGFPRAEPDDARSAVLAARRLVQSVRDAWERDTVALRVGVHTGPATIQGEERSNEIDLGETGETAGAMMRSAAAHEVVVSRVTEELVQSHFRCEALANPPADADAAPHRVVGERDVEGHLELLRRSPIVGREPEKAILLRRWRQVQEGRGQALLLSGPVGSGKSRLLQELLDNEATGDAFRLVCRCHRHEQSVPLSPVVRLMRRLLGCDENAEVSREDLEAFLGPFGDSLGDALPTFAHLVTQPLEKSEDVTQLPDDNVQGEMLDAILRLLTAMSERHPVLLLVEDVEWIDDGTRDLLSRILHQGPTISVLAVLTSRWPWDLAGVDHLGQLSLGLLDRQQSETLVRRLAPRSLPEVAVESILKRADGVPLFLEELTRALCNSDVDLSSANAGGDADTLASELAFLAIPPRLQDLFMAELDSLGSGRRLAQEAAVIGRSVPRKLLDAVTSFEPSEVDRLLERLVEHELLYCRGHGEKTRYLFRYALLQEAAYRSLPARERHAVHSAVTQALVQGED